MGRPKSISSPERLYQLFEAYKQLVKTSPFEVHDYVGKDAVEVHKRREKPLTLEGFENYVEGLGVIGTLAHYFMNYEGRYEAFVSICARIRREIRQDQIEGGMAGIYNPSITQRLNGLVERTDVTTQGEKINVDYGKLSDGALEEIVRASGAGSE
ncbi:terminase small subunit [Chitinophaga rhizosphaerae]|uniref:terminase small subunit n=1 Tax=Chitinophaga rhizosphaerae TaxID=1864947 RepID=UPI000F801E31|nr:terminase small subunit [Chitinophaga rhizosphaerae]